MKSKQGHHLPEIVVPFLKNPIYGKKEKQFIPRAHQPIPFENRFLLPGSEWLFVKFYLEEEGEERFLAQHLFQLADYLNKEGGGIGWFFVRYNDPENHVRFRMRFRSVELASKSMRILEEVTRNWMKEGLIKDIAYAVYEREVERYGGLDFIDDAESVFFQDTLATINLLQASVTKANSCPPSVLRSISVISFLRDFKLTDEEKILFLGTQINNKSELKGFREHRNLLVNLIKELDHSEESPSAEIITIKKSSKLRTETCHLFNLKLKQLSDFERLNVYGSLLHLHCNRLGCDANEESQAYLYARQALVQLKHLQKARHEKKNLEKVN